MHKENAMLEKFIKTYAGDYKFTTMLRHKGVTDQTTLPVFKTNVFQ